MASGTYAHGGGGVCQFLGNSIGIDVNAIETLATGTAAKVFGRREIPLVWPYVALSVGIGYAGKDDVDLLHFAIAVPVVVCIVEFGVCEFQCLDNHLGSPIVEVVVRRRTVVFASLWHGDWANDVEVDGEHAITLFDEVVAYGTYVVELREALLIEAVVPLCGGIVFHFACCVGKLDEQNESLLCIGFFVGTEWAFPLAECDVFLAHFFQTLHAAFVDARQTLGVMVAAND